MIGTTSFLGLIRGMAVLRSCALLLYLAAFVLGWCSAEVV